MNDLLEGARLNTLLWGGQYNPLLPISVGDNPFAEQLLKLFPVDIVYAVTDAPEIGAFKQKYPLLRDPSHLAENLFYPDWDSKKKIAGLLDSKRIVDYYWDKELKHKPADFTSNCILPKWNPDDPLASLFVIAFGEFPNEVDAKTFQNDYEAGFKKGLKAKQIEIPSDAEIPPDLGTGITPIVATGLELIQYGGGRIWESGGIYIGDASNFDDLLTFWNLRASGLRLMYLARDAIDRTQGLVQNYVGELEKRVSPQRAGPDYIMFYHRIADNDAIMAIVKRIKSKKEVAIGEVTPLLWNGLNIRPADQVFMREMVVADVDRESGSYQVVVRLPEKRFLIDTRGRSSFQNLALSIDAFSEFTHPDHTLKPPFIHELNEFYSRKICFDPWKLRTDRDGIRLILQVHDSSVSLRPIHHKELIEKLFGLAGITAKISQPGLLTTRVVEKLGGVDGGRVFKLKGVRTLLQKLKPSEAIERARGTRIIHEEDFEKHKGLYIEARDKKDLDSQAVFDFLLKKDFFRAGVELICDHCNLANWLSLKQLDDEWSCEYCGDRNKTSLHLKHRGDWKFRKSGLFAKDNNQEGAIPVVLTLLFFLRLLEIHRLTYSTALKLDGHGVNCETDFVVLQYYRGDEIELAIGECKSEGGTITVEDCQKLLSVQKLLDEKGWHSYIVFSKTADSFTNDEIALFKGLVKDKVSIVLLANKELEPYHPYWEKNDEGLPHKYAHTLCEIAENSIARYLK